MRAELPPQRAASEVEKEESLGAPRIHISMVTHVVKGSYALTSLHRSVGVAHDQRPIARPPFGMEPDMARPATDDQSVHPCRLFGDDVVKCVAPDPITAAERVVALMAVSAPATAASWTVAA